MKKVEKHTNPRAHWLEYAEPAYGKVGNFIKLFLSSFLIDKFSYRNLSWKQKFCSIFLFCTFHFHSSGIEVNFIVHQLFILLNLLIGLSLISKEADGHSRKVFNEISVKNTLNDKFLYRPRE